MEEVLSAQGASRPWLSQKTPGLERLAALSGAASVVLWIAGFTLTEHGGQGLSPDQSVAAIGAGFAERADEARVGSALLIAAVALSLVFLGPLWSRLHRGAPPLAVVAVAGGIVGAAFLLVIAMFALGAVVAADVGDGQTARTLLVLEWESARALVAPALVTVAAATVAGLRHHILPRWFSWLSLAFAVVLFVGLFPVAPAGMLAMTGGLWTVGASLLLASGR